MYTPLPAPLRFLLSLSLTTPPIQTCPDSPLPRNQYSNPLFRGASILYNSIYSLGSPLYMAADTAETCGWSGPGVLLPTCEKKDENVNKECISTVQLVYTVLTLRENLPSCKRMQHSTLKLR